VTVCHLRISLELKHEPLLIIGNVVLLRCCPLKRNARIEMAAGSQFTMFLSILTNCVVNARNLFVSAGHMTETDFGAEKVMS